ncbi:putative c-3 sterol dehydrogenase c-4 decarboxylase protein [Botrytis fragariae]|uniref:Putative c-3 sterol dehydrogenase c-4 decarboxylase protein n=1 Tax=Botrytis fragariae TaxID=1964551 RepID=A0A8H6EM36_9HELO|nr:putative c-3 sterol dehydrogenase c-4 decarboxylase protein [Botrytis fragariae]KAF5876915.1 putative c-3 sterol dehydrogenase c-4 decarboxylase protein [Botrytis fragariae]
MYHIVQAVLQQPSFKSVHVFSRNLTINLLPGVSYHAGSLTSLEDIKLLFDLIKTTLIFLVASPVSFGNTANASLFHKVIVRGTQNLLDCAARSLYTKALIYTSSTTVSKPPYHFNDETQPLTALNSKADFNYYTVTKAIADIAVLEANNPKGLKTCCLRIAPIYGKYDVQMIPGTLGVLQEKYHHSPIGDNTALMDFVSKRSPKISGEAFFITDGNPVHFGDFAKSVWVAAGTTVDREDIRVFPAWFMIGLAVVTEWIYWTCTFGTVMPEKLRSHTMRYITEDRTFSIEKARERLGCRPVDDIEENI